MSKTIGFIGLGNMGLGMAANLVKAGHRVYAYDLSVSAMANAEGLGCISASTVETAVKNSDVVISMLPNGRIVENLYIDQQTLLDIIPKFSLVIDCSTVAPATSVRLASEGKKREIRVIDAPVSGGTAAAEAGTLAFMCGGGVEEFEEAKHVLSAMGKNIFRAGDNGAGQTAKICNNMLLAIQMAGTAEALQLGVNGGIDPAVLSEIMSKSSGNNWVLEKYNPYPGVAESVPASRNYEGGFMVNLMCKDLGLAMDAALNSASYVPMGALANSLFGIHRKAGDQDNSNLDFSSIQRLFPNT